MRETAPAKVNLFLHVLGRRPDGYHLLDSLAVFGPAADALEVTPGPLSLRVGGTFAAGLAGEGDNLVIRAARALAEVEMVKLGQIAQPLRAAVTGSTQSPGLFDVLAALGKDETLGRIDDAALRMEAKGI